MIYLEHSDLPHCYLLDEGVILGLDKLLDGHQGPSLFVATLEHNAIGALSNASKLIILIHHDSLLHIQVIGESGVHQGGSHSLSGRLLPAGSAG